MKKILAGLTLSLALMGGCARNVSTSVPATPSTPYQRAAVGMSNFASDVQQVQTIEINLYKGTAVSPAFHRTFQSSMKQVSVYGPQIDALIAAGASPATIQAKISTAITLVQGILLSTNTLDSNTASQLNVAIQALQILLTNVSQIVATNTSELSPLHNPVTSEVTHGSSTDRASRGTVATTRIHYLPASSVLRDSRFYQTSR